jgi:triacylglycerol esterase/lipase EstA (alpha/beta hydrolase family)
MKNREKVSQSATNPKEPKAPKEPIDWKGKWEITKKVLKQSKTTGVSVLNGAVGDHLEHFAILAQEMNFYRFGVPLTLSKEELKSLQIGSKLCILVHGLVSDETMWSFAKSTEDYGTLLEKDFSYSPFYARYNSGRHISDNGQDLDKLLETLVSHAPKSIKEIIFICHSMGGLVTRSACYYGTKRKSKWVSLTKKIVFIGSPHHGAPLEKFGNAVTTVLDKIPNPFTYLTKKAINLRSAGIKDLRYGFLVEEDWKGKDPDSFVNSEKKHVPLLKNTQYYVITGTLMENPNHFLSEFFGDAIVGKWSAKGKSGNSKYDLTFSEKNSKEFPGITHIKLMHDRRIYDQIRIWLAI